MLKLKKFTVTLQESDKILARDIDLTIKPGEIHLIMGPNGAGKSSLVKGIMRLPEVATTGSIELDGKDLTKLEISERALAGLYLAYQSPVEIPGVKLLDFMRSAFNLRQKEEDKLDPWSFAEIFEVYAAKLDLPQDIHQRNLNEGLSGGEKKKCEILQMMLLEPQIALLDEIDSGLDLDALKTIFKQVTEMAKEKDTGILVISHNPNILQYLTPDKVHLMIDSKLIKTGGAELVEEIIEKGYANTNK